MIRWIVGSSLRSRGLVVALAAVAVVLGVSRLGDMPRDALPEFSRPTVEVQTEALGLSAEEVEQLITVPLEQDLLNGVAFLDVIRSESLPGLSRIEMIFEPGTPVARARQVVNERLTQAHALPHVSKPPQMLQPLSSTSRVMMVGLSSNDRSLIDVSVLARWTIRPALMGIPGVANVSIWGQREQQLQVQVDPVRLRDVGVTLDQVIRTTGNALWVSPLTFLEASTPGTGGFYDTQSQRLGVQHTQPIRTPADLARVTLEEPPPPPAAPADPAAEEEVGTGPSAAVAPPPPPPVRRLGDVTTVVQDHQPLIGDAVLTDRPGLLLVVEKFPEANPVEVTRDLDHTLDSLKPGLAGIDVDSSLFRPARYIESSTDGLRNALLPGLVLLVIALGALLWDVRTAVVTFAGVLLSLVAGIAVLHLRGETLDAMVLAGLALALVVVVDDAVLGAESVRRALRRPDGDDGGRVSRLGAAVLEAHRPLLYATAALLLVLVPVFVLEGEMGAFLPPLALSYGGAVLASMLVALTVVPALALLVMRGAPPEQAEPPAFRWLRPRYEAALVRTSKAHRAAFAAGGLLLLLGAATLPFIERGSSLVPELKDRDLLIRWDGASGTSLPETTRVLARASQELRALPGINNVGGHVGRAILGDQAVGVNSAEMWVNLDASADYGKTVDAVEDVVGGYPGFSTSVLTYPKERIADVLTTPDGVPDKDLTVRVFGLDYATLQAQAAEVSRAVSEVDGVEAPVSRVPVTKPTLEVEVNLDRAQARGIKPGDVRRAAATVFSGIEVGSLYEEQKIFEVVVWGTPASRGSVDTVRQLLVDKPDGSGQVALGDVADVRIAPHPDVIRHEDVSRYVDVGVDVSGRDLDAAAGDIEDRIHAMTFPLEYHAELLGDFRDEQAQRWAFAGVSVAVALGIFLLLQAAFSSWRMATAAFLGLVCALAGGFVGALIAGDPVSIGTIAGFLGVLALTVRHGVLFVARGQELEDDLDEPFGTELVHRAAHDRFAPALTAAALVVAVFVPVLVLGGGAGREILRPLAAVVVGGVVTTTVVNLFLLPALYLRFGLRPPGAREHIDLDRRLDVVSAEDLVRESSAETPVPA